MKRTPDSVVSLDSAMVSGKQFLSRRLQRGREEFAVEHLRAALDLNADFASDVVSRFVDEGWIEPIQGETPEDVPEGLAGMVSTTYRICPKILEVTVTSYLGLTVDESRLTIQRSNFCRHVVTLSPVQFKLAAAMCEGREAGIVVSQATNLRGGEKTGERQFRTSFNRSISLLGIRLERFAWKLVEKSAD